MMNQINKIPIDKIQGLIDLAVQEQLSWQLLAPVLDELTPTIAISKQVIKILLTELETLQLKVNKNLVLSCSNCDKSTPATQDEETECQIQYRDQMDWEIAVNESDEADEINDKETQSFKDSVPDEEDICFDTEFTCDETFVSSIEFRKHEKVLDTTKETLRKLLDRGEKLYTFVGDTDILDGNGTIGEMNIVRCARKNIDKEIKTKEYVEERNEKTMNKCSTCSKEFKSKSHLIRHEMIHTYECNSCKKCFPTKENLKTHEKIHSKQFQCKTCEKCFSVKKSLKSHEIQIHSNEKPYQCTSCPKGFSIKSKLDQHKMIHTGEVPFQCKVCKKRFTLKGNLTKHEIIHSSEKPYKCEICSKTFNHSQNLTKHIQIHILGEKSYSCRLCEKCFNTKQSLEVHERIHTGKKPFKCETCSKIFRVSHQLTLHNQKHAGEKPCKCQTCNKHFSTNSALKIHEKRTHKLSQS